MKKTLVSFLAAGVMTLPGYAQDVGDPMPSVENERLNQSQPIVKKEEIKVWRDHYHDKDGQCSKTAVYRVCADVRDEKPYALFDFKNKILYLDHNMDGIIDEKIPSGPERKVMKDRPPCDSENPKK